MPVPFPRGLTEGTSLKHPLLPRLACCTGTCLAQGSNGGNRPPAMTMLPSILKTFNNVKKPDLTQFIKKIYTARAFFTLSSWFTNTPQATWKPEPEAVPLSCLGLRVLCTLAFFFNTGHFILSFWVPLCSFCTCQWHSVSTVQPRRDHWTLYLPQKEKYMLNKERPPLTFSKMSWI